MENEILYKWIINMQEMRNDIACLSVNQKDEAYIIIRHKDGTLTIKNYGFMHRFLKDIKE